MKMDRAHPARASASRRGRSASCRRHGARARLALLAVALAAACARPAPPAAAPTPMADAALQPGDVVRLTIWREPDLSGQFAVDARGVVVLPKLGEYDVAEETAASLRERLKTDYDRFLINPSIEVTVTRSVRVLGAVGRPGYYQVQPTMTIADALALAGGPADWGRTDRIELRRDGVVVVADVTEATPLMSLPIRSGDEIRVPRKSWIAHNPAAMVTSVSALLGLVITLMATR